MDHAVPVPANLYAWYCDYIHHVNQSARRRSSDMRDIIVASESDFLAIWNTLSESRRNLWRRKFEAGYDEIANSDRRKLAAALSCGSVDQTDFNASRAA